jgi:putative Mg2+ transporter-C (MgtC) family protein
MESFAVTDLEFMLRLVFAAALGLLIGTERSRVGKRAGMRTYALVSLGACLFIVLSGAVAARFADTFAFDPLRVASQIVVGIGFLGAGVIFVQKNELTGLTTAAGLWVVAAIGAACGFGLYAIAAFSTFLPLFIFEVLWYVEERFVRIADKTDGGEIVSRIKHHHGEED